MMNNLTSSTADLAKRMTEMSKQVIRAHLYYDRCYGQFDGEWTYRWRYVLRSYKMEDQEDCLYIEEVEALVEVPDKPVDVVAKPVAALRRQQEQAHLECAKKIAEINERIQKYLAIENNPSFG